MSTAPLVVAVVVAHEPGEWFDDCLRSLGASDYPNLSTVVVDSNSRRAVSEIVDRSLPNARYQRLEHNGGFAHAANFGASLVKDATYLLFCHDDVAFATDAITSMVEVGFAYNAGVIAGKIMVWDSPSQILQLGIDLDRTAAMASRIDVGDLDQSQYDQVEEVSVAPGGAVLVRADLFAALGGFDEAMYLYYEDVDLSWRAHLVGARVVTAPQARIRHLMVSTLAPASPRQGRRRSRVAPRARSGVGHLQRITYTRRHQLRTLLKDYLGPGRTRALLTYLLMALIEGAYYFVSGRPRLARAVLSSISWNYARRKETKAARDLQLISYLPGASPVRFVGGSVKMAGYLMTRRTLARIQKRNPSLTEVDHDEHPPASPMMTFRADGVEPKPEWPSQPSTHHILERASKATLVITLAGTLIGIRGLLFGNIPLLGSFAHFPSALTLLGNYFSGHYATPLYGQGAAPPSFLIFGIVGLLFLSHMGVMAHLVVVASIALGAVSIYRLLRTDSSKVAPRFGASAYLCMPLLAEAFSVADFRQVMAFGLAPTLILLLRRGASSQRGPRRTMRRTNLLAGIILGVAFSLAPALLFAFVAYVVLSAMARYMSGERAAARREFSSLLVMVIVALAVTFPWSVEIALHGVVLALLFGGQTPGGESVISLLGLGSTPEFSVGIASLGFVVFGFTVLFAARPRRVGELAKQLFIVAGLIFLSVLVTEGVLGGTPIPVAYPLLFVAVALAEITGIGMAALNEDLPNFRLGVRHVGAGVSVLLLVAAVLPALPRDLGGRMGLPPTGYEASMSFLDHLPQGQAVLWLGDPAQLPLGGFKLANGLSMAVTSSAVPDYRTLWIPPSYGPASKVVLALRGAVAGETVQLGESLARFGIYYIVIPQPTSQIGFFFGSDLDLIFERQVDLQQLLVDPSVVAFKVLPRAPAHPQLSPTSELASLERVGGLVVQGWLIIELLLAFVRRKSLLTSLDRDQLKGYLKRARRRTGSGSLHRSGLKGNEPSALLWPDLESQRASEPLSQNNSTMDEVIE